MVNVGEKLANGAIVLAASRDNEGQKVLAFFDHGPEKFVTWRLDFEANAYWGHYHSNLETAMENYQRR